MSDSTLKAVVYSDGGCRPSRGHAGYGYHGYLYTPEKPKHGHGAKAIPTAEGYMDQKHKTKEITVVKYIDGWGSIEGTQTNNVAELKGAIQALTQLIALEVTSVLLYLDSQYVQKGLLEWVKKWIANDWCNSQGEAVPNRVWWESLLALKEQYKTRGIDLDVRWVEGHSGDLGNTIADEYATRGVFMGMKGIIKEHQEISDPKGYWHRASQYNRMVSKNQWYFTTHVPQAYRSDDGRYIYHLGSAPNREQDGKPTSETSYSVVYLKEPMVVLDQLREFTDRQIEGSTKIICVGDLTAITNPKNYLDIEQYGTDHLMISPKDWHIEAAGGSLLTNLRKPVMTAYKAVESLQKLESLLLSYLAPLSHTDTRLSVMDITDYLYDVSLTKKGKTQCNLRKEITTTVKGITVPVVCDFRGFEVKDQLKLLMDMDLPSRNVLAALAKTAPKVSTVCWLESSEAYRYACIVETQDDVGIWSSVYSNLKLIEDTHAN